MMDESKRRRNRAVVLVGLVLAALVCWFFLVDDAHEEKLGHEEVLSPYALDARRLANEPPEEKRAETPGAGAAVDVDPESLTPASADERAELALQFHRADGRPVEGEVVTLSHSGRSNSVHFPVRSMKTDAEGRVLFEDLELKTWSFALRPWVHDFIELTSPGRQERSIVLPAGVRVEGRVVDSADVPVPRADLYLDRLGYGGLIGRADETGAFVLNDIPGDHGCLMALHPGYGPSLGKGILGRNGDRISGLELVLEDLGMDLSGRVEDLSGRPIAGARLVMSAVGLTETGLRYRASAFLEQETRSAEDGSFHFPSLPFENATLRVRAPGYAFREDEVQAESRAERRIVLSPSGSLRGRVLTLEGEPVAMAKISSGENRWMATTSCYSDAGGHFLLEGITPGSTEIRAEAKGVGAFRDVVLIEAEEIVARDIVLDPGRTIRGILTDASGQPRNDLRVMARSRAAKPDGSGEALHVHGARSGKDGRFLIPNCEDEVFDLQIAEQGAVLLEIVQEVRPSKASLVIRLDDQKLGRVKGSIRARDVLEGSLTVTLRKTSYQKVALATGESAFEFKKVYPGDYEVMLSRPGYNGQAQRWAQVASFSLKPGEELDLGVLDAEFK